jgi:hypothetical protein
MEVLVIIGIFVISMLLIQGFFTGVEWVIKGCMFVFGFIIMGLGVLFGIGVTCYFLFQMILGG